MTVITREKQDYKASFTFLSIFFMMGLFLFFLQIWRVLDCFLLSCLRIIVN
jgi:hypothetical protein